MKVILPRGYRPSADESFMNERQLEYFRRQLLKWRADLMAEAQETLDNLRDKAYQEVVAKMGNEPFSVAFEKTTDSDGNAQSILVAEGKLDDALASPAEQAGAAVFGNRGARTSAPPLPSRRNAPGDRRRTAAAAASTAISM